MFNFNFFKKKEDETQNKEEQQQIKTPVEPQEEIIEEKSVEIVKENNEDPFAFDVSTVSDETEQPDFQEEIADDVFGENSENSSDEIITAEIIEENNEPDELETRFSQIIENQFKVAESQEEVIIEVKEELQEPVIEQIETNIEPEIESEPKPEIRQQEPETKSFSFSFFNLKETIEKTSKNLVENVISAFSEGEKIDDDMIDEIEENLIKADLGLETSIFITEILREKQNTITTSSLRNFLKEEFVKILETETSNHLNLKPNQLNIVLITGVNGAGKTTLIGKLAYRLKQEGKKVLVAAADTFRAAAEEQLEIWSHRAGAQIVRNDGADPASVVFDAIQKAKEENFDILLVDTAGRLQNKFNLMEELKKIKKVIDKEAPENLMESILVIDATTGQNGLKQAEVFKETVDLTSVALTKLDGSAKGGIVIAIAKELKIPVKLVGVGEKIGDIRDFNSKEFIEALF